MNELFKSSMNALPNDVLRRFSLAVCSHAWKDASSLLSTVVAMAKCSIPPMYVWKATLLVMLHSKDSLNEQIEMVSTMMGSPLNEYMLALSWIMANFDSLEQEQLDRLHTLVLKRKLHDSQDIKWIYNSYLALHKYKKWTKGMNDNRKIEDVLKEGLNVHSYLIDSMNIWYALVKNEDLQNDKNANDGKEKKYYNTQRAEWIFGPLLDTEVRLIEYLSNEKFVDENSKRKDCYRDIEKLNSLVMVKEYISKNNDHAPAVRLVLAFLFQHHPSEDTLILEAFQKLHRLSPSDALILEYAKRRFKEGMSNSLIGKQTISENSTCNSQEKNSETCFLKAIKSGTVEECLKLVSRLVEFQEWSLREEPWDFLKKILTYVQHSFLRCWKCTQCVKLRNFSFEFVQDYITMWPLLYWNIPNVRISKEEARVQPKIAYMAYIFGCQDSVLHEWIDALSKAGFPKRSKKLEDMVSRTGPFTEEFNIHREQLNYLQVSKVL